MKSSEGEVGKTSEKSRIPCTQEIHEGDYRLEKQDDDDDERRRRTKSLPKHLLFLLSCYEFCESWKTRRESHTQMRRTTVKTLTLNIVRILSWQSEEKHRKVRKRLRRRSKKRENEPSSWWWLSCRESNVEWRKGHSKGESNFGIHERVKYITIPSFGFILQHNFHAQKRKRPTFRDGSHRDYQILEWQAWRPDKRLWYIRTYHLLFSQRL